MAEKYYYLIAPLQAGGSQKSLFTYYADTELVIGALVKVPFGRRAGIGLVIQAADKPKFATKAVAEVLDSPPLPPHLIELATWMSDYYVSPLGRVLQTMLPTQLAVKKPRPITTAAIKLVNLPSLKLIPQQAAAINQIVRSKQTSFLLHGVTGSGKTQVYIELAAKALAAGHSTIMLVPEISLTPQIERQFQARFGSQVLVTHSALTAAQRRSLWQTALRSPAPLVVIGPRSALFTTFKQLGFIIIDEAHESSYKQEQSPRYQTASVAAKLASLTGAKLVLGSATPAASDVFLAEAKRLELIGMPQRIFQPAKSTPQLVDLREPAARKLSPFISRALLKTLKTTLEKRKQSILFINRRGSARLALCTNCNWVAICPNCQIPLTFHADRGVLLCHWCDHRETPPAKCPDCGHLEIRFLGGGTKRVEVEVAKLLPSAKVVRLDKDSLDPKTMHSLFEQLNSGKIDILIGTQMVAKGLDLPNVETIGVILADTMLYLPDFTAAERTFQLLYQVSGRAGRREGGDANVIIQTYSPQHPAIQAAVTGDYQNFIKNELEERKLLNYPPYVYLLKLSVSRSSRPSAQQAGENLIKWLSKYRGIQAVGPAPAWRETLRGKFQWQVIVKSRVRSKLAEIANNLPDGWTHDLDPINLL